MKACSAVEESQGCELQLSRDTHPCLFFAALSTFIQGSLVLACPLDSSQYFASKHENMATFLATLLPLSLQIPLHILKDRPQDVQQVSR